MTILPTLLKIDIPDPELMHGNSMQQKPERKPKPKQKQTN